MHVGLCYDLRSEYLAQGLSLEETAEFDSLETIDAISASLAIHGARVEKIGGVKALVTKLVSGARWDLVFNIAEGLYGRGREAQVPALLDAYQIPYTFSDTTTLALTLHKGFTKIVTSYYGIPTAPFCVVNSIDDLHGLELPFPLFVKPVAEGSSKGIDARSYVQAAADLRYACERVWHIYDQPALVETYLPGREFTVGVFGTGAAAEAYLMEIKLKPWAEKYAYSFENKEADQIEYNLTNDAEAERAKRIALQAWRVLGCRDAGRVDVRADANGNPNFIEVNPLAGLHPAHSNLILLGKLNGLSYDEMIGRILSSATARLSVSS